MSIIFVKGLYILSFLHVCFCISIQGLLKCEYDKNNNYVLTEFSRQHGGLRGEGIFVSFLRNVLDLLSTSFPERKLARYFRILSRELEKMETKYTRRLATYMRHVSRMYREDIKEQVLQHRQQLDKPLPFRSEFLQAMNEVFTLRENLLFDDYVNDLKDYGNEDKLFIHEETKKVLNEVIVSAIHKLSHTDRIDLERKMKRAIKEYN